MFGVDPEVDCWLSSKYTTSWPALPFTCPYRDRYSGLTFFELKLSCGTAAAPANSWKVPGWLFATAFWLAFFTSPDMKYMLSSVVATASLLELQEDITTAQSSRDTGIIVIFFMGEVDCCLVIRFDQVEVALFGLYLCFLPSQNKHISLYTTSK